jgi:hypothetical protein
MWSSSAIFFPACQSTCGDALKVSSTGSHRESALGLALTGLLLQWIGASTTVLVLGVWLFGLAVAATLSPRCDMRRQ